MPLEPLALAGVLVLVTAPQWVASLRRTHVSLRRWTRRRALDRMYREERSRERVRQ